MQSTEFSTDRVGDAPNVRTASRPTLRRIDPPALPRNAPPASASRFKDLGVSPLVLQLRLQDEQTFGHWCSRCEGIWFGMCLEAQCPVCGNRSG